MYIHVYTTPVDSPIIIMNILHILTLKIYEFMICQLINSIFTISKISKRIF